MSGVTHVQEPLQQEADRAAVAPASFLNAYEIINAGGLSWPVNIYAVDLKDGEPQTHDKRGKLRDIIWELRKQHANLCKGAGFVVDISPRLVAVPAGWRLPVPINTTEYSLSLQRSYTARPGEASDCLIVEGILREAIKWHFKNSASQDLGRLWQDYGDFCQYPVESGEQYLMCRRFGCSAKVLRGGLWVVQVCINTATIDGRTFEDYYRLGEVQLLAERLEAKRRDRVTRDNLPVMARVFRQFQVGSSKAETVDLEDIDAVLQHAQLPPQQQRGLATSEVKCRPFKKALVGVPLRELRLILDSAITQEEHSETIIEPDEREALMHRVRQFLDGGDAYGQTIRLAEEPFDAERLKKTILLPPAVRVRSADGGQEFLPAPTQATEEALRSRGRDRLDRVRKNGFLERRPLFPLLAWPIARGRHGGAKIKEDLELIWSEQGIKESFEPVYYSQVDDIRRAVEDGRGNVVLAVLPEPSSWARNKDNTHERIKRALEVPSQCINIDHTRPRKYLHQSWDEMRRADRGLARRLRNTYEMALGSLLVKHHWFPFAPASPFHYNVQVGLDVGGVHNTAAMACVGYGFRRPWDGLLFLPDEIPIDVQKKEPIPTGCLFSGLLRLFELVQSQIVSEGSRPDYEKAAFYLDGKLLGAGDEWNKLHALRRLHEELANRQWVTRESVWTVVEVLKPAEGWRVFRNAAGIENPVVGGCIFPYEDEQAALVCTTGAPYLTQGTAQPLMVRVSDVFGRSERDEALQDLFWQCDMCFTKPDIGLSLPWVLHVADKGALQLSRSYRISGITA
jgi:hypothetical protein